MAPEARLKSQVHLNLVFDLAVKITEIVRDLQTKQISNPQSIELGPPVWGLIFVPMLVKQALIRVGF